MKENELGKINFPFGKMEFWNDSEFFAYHRIFGFSKGPIGSTLSKSKSVCNCN